MTDTPQSEQPITTTFSQIQFMLVRDQQEWEFMNMGIQAPDNFPIQEFPRMILIFGGMKICLPFAGFCNLVRDVHAEAIRKRL